MRRIFTTLCAIAFSLVMALAFGGCSITVNIGTQSGSAGSSAASATSPSSASEQASQASGSPYGQDASSGSASAYGGNGASASGVTEDGQYSDKEHVALYIHEYGHLPSNYISKTKAKKAGWVSTKGNLWDVLPGMSIGGSELYNDEGALPDAAGRRWTECDIDYEGGYRNAKRIVFSNDGLVFYTDDHYKTFEQLY